ncbi:bifunctional riboflavin kinase/FAD synthetase [Candidatus Igneacidithiobacillus taiwanensis]|uniref:bifunctional riboflavin kinase/FAD synthetase n=1 Tax=Candidatus Igneacidithiobacillus taiwanensis TaxID=1945924 RepID=UPI002897A148|nr:bifunctional riboflavin kinase/FAD synthetase [Candidatus Igneacidithiobacillus taiwanensis]
MTSSFRLHRIPRRPLAAAQALTIGNFDGVHLGHQQLLAAMGETRLPRVVLTFEPLPREFFQGAESPVRLSSLREKTQALLHYGADQVICSRFDRRLAQLSAEDFVREILVGRLQVRHLFVGHDFRFGAQRRGDFTLLEQMGRQLGFTVAEQPPFLLDGQRVSSTGVRQFLEQGDLGQAARWLGRPYAICGRVRRGDQLGRELGFPTANLPLTRRSLPLRGIFAGRLHSPIGSWQAAISIGLRPTVNGKHLVLEAHCLDADSPNLYGLQVQVELLHKLRDEEKYPNLDVLIAAIQHDVGQVRQFFASSSTSQSPWITKTP